MEVENEMSRDGSGIYSAPAGTTATAGTTIESAKYNAFVSDLVTDANTARPIVAGGTGATTAPAALIALGLTATAAEINIMDGVTATTAEINKLAGTPAGLTSTEIGYLDGVTSAIQTQLDAKQASDTDLTALAGVSSTGILARIGSGTAAARTITAGTGVTVTNGDGVSGNPTIGIQRLIDGPYTLSSGTTQAFANIPTWATRVNIHFENLDTSASATYLVQIGPTSGVVTTGYDSGYAAYFGNATVQAAVTSGFPLRPYASGSSTGTFRLAHMGSNTWISSGNIVRLATGGAGDGAGSITLSGTAEPIRITLSASAFTGSGRVWAEYLP